MLGLGLRLCGFLRVGVAYVSRFAVRLVVSFADLARCLFCWFCAVSGLFAFVVVGLYVLGCLFWFGGFGL